MTDHAHQAGLEMVIVGMDDRLAKAILEATITRARHALALCIAQRNAAITMLCEKLGEQEFGRESITFGNDQLADTLLGVGE